MRQQTGAGMICQDRLQKVIVRLVEAIVMSVMILQGERKKIQPRKEAIVFSPDAG